MGVPEPAQSHPGLGLGGLKFGETAEGLRTQWESGGSQSGAFQGPGDMAHTRCGELPSSGLSAPAVHPGTLPFPSKCPPRRCSTQLVSLPGGSRQANKGNHDPFGSADKDLLAARSPCLAVHLLRPSILQDRLTCEVPPSAARKVWVPLFWRLRALHPHVTPGQDGVLFFFCSELPRPGRLLAISLSPPPLSLPAWQGLATE